MNMHLGEKIESIILSRESGKLGLYLGNTASTFGMCRVDGVTYRVKRFIEIDSKYYWTVQDLDTLNVAYSKDKDSIASLKKSDFERLNPVIN